MTNAAPTIFDTFVSEITKNLDEVLDNLRADFNGPTDGDVREDTAPEVADEEENDLTPENLLNEAIRLLQLAEETAADGTLTSGTYTTLADRYIYLAENV